MELNLDQLRSKKIFLATPMYGGQCHGSYAKSIADLMSVCTKYGIDIKLFYMFNESLITRARNYLTDEFLRSDYDHLLFVDSDIQFEPADVLVMQHYAVNYPNMGVICGPYPKKAISWEKIRTAAKHGVADDNPNILEDFVGDYVFNPIEGITSFKINEPVQVKEGGTGFMMIQRDVFEKFDKTYPERLYNPDHVRTVNFDGSRQIMAYFDCIIDPESKRYLSEDYMFCQYARKAGSEVWMLPWVKLKHCGSYVFGGSLAAIATINESPTASLSSPKN